MISLHDQQRPRRYTLCELTVWNTRFAHQDKRTQTLQAAVCPSAQLLRELEDNTGNVALIGCGGYRSVTTREKAAKWLNDDEAILFPVGGSACNIKYFKGLFCTANNYIGKSVNPEILLTEYLSLWLEEHVSVIDNMFIGTGIRKPDMRAVLSMEVQVPSVAYQQNVIDFLKKMRRYYLASECRSKQLTAIRDECFSKIIQKAT